MNKTRRMQANHIMAKSEKNDFIKIIRKLPWLYRPLLEVLEIHTHSSKSLLDVACGDGFLLELINSSFPKLNLKGIDIDPYFVNKAREQYTFNFEIKNAFDLDANYDIVTCNLALHHFDNPVALIEKITACANKIVIISDQLRPTTENELTVRMNKRVALIKSKDVPFYKENERASILESYSKEEIIEIFTKVSQEEKNKFNINYTDTDYYERFVAILEK